MNNKQRKILEAIFKTPAPTDLKYKEVISMLTSLGVLVKESSSGSRVLLNFKGCTQVIHRPHPQSVLKQYAIRIIRDFIVNAGVEK